jgi:hypothetical protein
MALRSGWDAKSDSYRSRLIGAGRTGKLTGDSMTPAQVRTYWEGGGDLRGGRSHRPRPAGAAPLRATQLEAAGQGGTESWEKLERWRKKPPSRGGPPDWLKDKRKWKRRPSAPSIDVQVTGSDGKARGRALPEQTPADRIDETVVSTDTAAILSQIDIPPARWKSVEMDILPSGRVLLTIQPKGNAYPRTAEFPDLTSAQQIGRLLNLS